MFGAFAAVVALSSAPVEAISAPAKVNGAGSAVIVAATDDPPCNFIRVLCPHK
jgi:hypothetical protein